MNNFKVTQKTTDHNEKDKIRRICEQRGIKYLVHFTRMDNLASILKHGLLGRERLEKMRIPYVYNDEQRIDRCSDAICLSISFPNYKMFYVYRKKLESAKWVVLVLKRDILWELDCAFCQENAASNNVRFIPLEERKKGSALEDLFTEYDKIHDVQRSSLGIPPEYTTNPQAEVLV